MTERINEGEVVVHLADGWTLRSGCTTEDFTSGEYVRLCTPVGEEYLYWHHEEWRDDPILVMGAIMNAAGGFRPIELKADIVRVNSLGSKWYFDQTRSRYRRTPLDGKQREHPAWAQQGGPLDDNIWHPYIAWNIDQSSKLVVIISADEDVITAPEAYVVNEQEDNDS